jgi:hypothetical protein
MRAIWVLIAHAIDFLTGSLMTALKIASPNNTAALITMTYSMVGDPRRFPKTLENEPNKAFKISLNKIPPERKILIYDSMLHQNPNQF